MKDTKTCEICGAFTHPLAHYCKRCKKLIDRVDVRRKPDKKARVKALKQAWDGECFRCRYSGIRLVEDDCKNPCYITFDHRVPRQENDIVVTAAVLNDMKSDMDEDEFKAVILQLSRYFEGNSFDENVFKLKHWRR